MSKINNDKVDKLIHKIALKYNMRDEDMKKLVNSPYEYTFSEINKMELDKIETIEELNETKTNFIYTAFFKLVVDWNTINSKLNRKNNIKHINSTKWKK